MLRSIKCKLNIRATMIYLLKLVNMQNYSSRTRSAGDCLNRPENRNSLIDVGESLLITLCVLCFDFSVSENQLNLMHFIHVSMTFIVNFQLRLCAQKKAVRCFNNKRLNSKRANLWSSKKNCFSTSRSEVRYEIAAT